MLDSKLFAAMDGEPEAREALDMIRDVYVIEHAARERGIVGTPEHRALRQAESVPIPLFMVLAPPPKIVRSLDLLRYASRLREAITDQDWQTLDIGLLELQLDPAQPPLTTA